MLYTEDNRPQVAAIPHMTITTFIGVVYLNALIDSAISELRPITYIKNSFEIQRTMKM
jgi:hypothetical protein